MAEKSHKVNQTVLPNDDKRKIELDILLQTLLLMTMVKKRTHPGVRITPRSGKGFKETLYKECIAAKQTVSSSKDGMEDEPVEEGSVILQCEPQPFQNQMQLALSTTETHVTLADICAPDDNGSDDESSTPSSTEITDEVLEEDPTKNETKEEKTEPEQDVMRGTESHSNAADEKTEKNDDTIVIN